MQIIHFIWVGEHPTPATMEQIQKAISSAKKHNPNHSIFLHSNVIPQKEVFDCIIKPIDFQYKDSPIENLKIAPMHEAPDGFLQTPPVFYSDVFRLFILWKYGGSYIDLDDISIRSLPTTPNMLAAGSRGPPWYKKYSMNSHGPDYQWRFGSDPMLNIKQNNPFFLELLSAMQIGIKNDSTFCNSSFLQEMMTRIFYEDPDRWVKHVSPTPWLDLLYHPCQDHYNKRYSGKLIKCGDKGTIDNIEILKKHYAFPLVKNHHWHQASTGDLTTLQLLLQSN